MLTSEQRESWCRDGFFLLPGFVDPSLCRAMHERAVELAREAGGAGMAGSAFVVPEARVDPAGREPEDGVSKIFKLHRDQPLFRAFVQDERLLAVLADLIGPGLDCFLSQFIFKNRGAMGQPWHQDSHYFPFDRAPQVGIWLAVTEATPENGCLQVVPGSHREPLHEHVPDPRPGANMGYVEIVDHDMSAGIPVRMQPGDLLVFHSHLMHRSRDNEGAELRAAMVYHLAQAGTVDHASPGAPINDWMPVRRRIATGLDIAAAPGRVREALLDGCRYPDWNPYLVRIEGTIAAGSEIVAHSRGEDGQEMEIPVLVVSVDGSSMVWEGGMPDRSQLKGDHRFEWEALPDGRTRLRHYEDFTGALMEPIVISRAATIEANFVRMNTALRDYCEAG